MSSPIGDNGGYATVTDIPSAQKSKTLDLPRLTQADMASKDSLALSGQNASTKKQKNQSVLWIVGGLVAGVAALALFKKDGESLLTKIFRREHPVNTGTPPTPHTPTRTDESLLDPSVAPDPGDMLQEMMSGLLGKRGGFHPILAFQRYRAGSLGSVDRVNNRVATHRAQADEMLQLQISGEAYAKAERRLEKAKAKYDKAFTKYSTRGSFRDRERLDAAQLEYQAASLDIDNLAKTFRQQVKRTKKASKRAAVYS